jgi:multiple sugar transport system ATP-binding protein
MIYVTHDQVEAMTMGDRIVLMKDGVVQQVGNPLELYNSPANRFVAGFVGTPAMNFFEGSLMKNGKLYFVESGNGIKLEVPSSFVTGLTRYIGKETYLGIRPEHIKLKGSDSGDLESSWPLRVEISELMRNEVYLYFSVASWPDSRESWGNHRSYTRD